MGCENCSMIDADLQWHIRENDKLNQQIADLKAQVEELTDKYVSEAQDLVNEQLANDKLHDEIADLKAQVAELRSKSNRLELWQKKHRNNMRVTELEAQVAELSVQKCTITKVCHWSEDEDGNWFGRCGIGWTFNERPSTPLDHGMKYCPRCAGVLLSETYEEAKAKEAE